MRVHGRGTMFWPNITRCSEYAVLNHGRHLAVCRQKVPQDHQHMNAAPLLNGGKEGEPGEMTIACNNAHLQGLSSIQHAYVNLLRHPTRYVNVYQYQYTNKSGLR
jgi:hypothetical protein